MIWSADFETTTDPSDCRVWAWAISNVKDSSEVKMGNTIDSFMEELQNQHQNPTCYFHNAKFDFQFIISWLLNNGFEYIDSKSDRKDNTFTALITDNGQFYSLEVYFKVYGKRVKKVTFRDSLKLLNFSVKQIAKNFGLKFQKLELDYETYREVGHQLTEHEQQYITHDVKIVAEALKSLFDRGLTKMTIGSNALTDFKQMCDNFLFFSHNLI